MILKNEADYLPVCVANMPLCYTALCSLCSSNTNSVINTKESGMHWVRPDEQGIKIYNYHVTSTACVSSNRKFGVFIWTQDQIPIPEFDISDDC